MSGYETMVTEDAVYQAAVSSSDSDAPEFDNPLGWIAKGVVTKVYFSDDPSWVARAWAATGPVLVYCDVRLFGRRNRQIPRVPVPQRVGGLFDEDLYIPRESKQNIGGGPLVADGVTVGPRPTPAELLDGDHVLVGFLECDPHQPFIYPFSLGHPKQRVKPRDLAGDGRIRRIRHNGSLFEIDKNGNVKIDASSAAMPELGPLGVEVLNPAGGTITITTKDAAKLELSLVLDKLTGTASLQAAGGTEKLTLTKGALAELKSALKVSIVAPTIELGGSSPVVKGDVFKTQIVAVLNVIAGLTTAPIVAKAAVQAFDTASATWLSTKTTTG